MKNSRNRVTLFNIGSTVILQGLAFFAGPLFASMLGKNNYGLASIYLTWTQIASIAFSLQAAGTYSVARVNFPEDEQEKYQSSVLCLATISFAAFSLLTVAVSFILSAFGIIDVRMVICSLVQGWGMYCVSALNSKFTYEFKAGRNFILSVAVSVLTIGSSILFILMIPEDINYWGRMIGQSSAYFLVGGFAFIYIVTHGKTVYNKKYWLFSLPIAIPTIFHLLAHILLNQSDKLMVQGLINNSEAGIYSLAYTFSTVVSIIYSALNNSWVPFYFEYTKNNEIEKMKKHSRNYCELFTVIAVGYILLAKEVFHIYARRDYWDGTDLIPLFAAGYYFVFLYSFAVNFEFYNKKTRMIAVGTCSAALCNVILNYFMINQWGIMGAVIATLVSHGLQFVFHFIAAKMIKESDFPFCMKDFIPGIAVITAVCVLYWFTRDLWFIRWPLAGMIGIYELIKIVRRREIF